MNLLGLGRFPAVVCHICDASSGRSLTIGPSGSLANTGFFQNQLQTSSSLIWAHGAHTISTGFNFDLGQLNIINRNNQVATLNADDFPSLLQGNLNPAFSKFFSGATSRYYRAKQVGAYVQDNFKVRSNLTLNLGLRYDWDGPLTEKNGMLANFDASRYQYDAASDTIIDRGIVIAGNNKTIGTRGVSDSTMKGRQWGFGPRVGFAWSPSFAKNFVVRGGFGIYYDRGEFFSEFSPGFGPNGTGGRPWHFLLLPNLRLPAASPILSLLLSQLLPAMLLQSLKSSRVLTTRRSTGSLLRGSGTEVPHTCLVAMT